MLEKKCVHMKLKQTKVSSHHGKSEAGKTLMKVLPASLSLTHLYKADPENTLPGENKDFNESFTCLKYEPY